MKPKMKRLPVRTEATKIDRFAKICDKQKFSKNLVLEKYIDRVIYEGKIDVSEWA
jgi:hypothetical protein